MWSYLRRKNYSANKITMLCVFSALVIVYLVSTYMRKLFVWDMWNLCCTVLGYDFAYDLFSSSIISIIGPLFSFSVTFLVFYLTLYVAFVRPKSPYFKYCATIWFVYSVIITFATWITFATTNTHSLPELAGEVSALVLITPIIVGVVTDRYYCGGRDSEETLQDRVIKILLTLLTLNFGLNIFSRLHKIIFLLWMAETIAVVFFCVIILHDNYISHGETFRAILRGELHGEAEGSR